MRSRHVETLTNAKLHERQHRVSACLAERYSFCATVGEAVQRRHCVISWHAARLSSTEIE